MSTLTTEVRPVYALEIRAADSHSPSRARHWAGWVLETAGVPQDTADTALLVLSELVTNAAIHAGGRILASVELLDAGLRLAVHDDAPLAEPQEQPDEELPEHGRGLLIVEALAELHVESDGSGTTVSALVPLASIGAGA